jgi:hypothetical protein
METEPRLVLVVGGLVVAVLVFLLAAMVYAGRRPSR